MVSSKGIEECHSSTEWNSVSSTTNHATVKPLAALPGSWRWPDNSNSNHTRSLPAISDQEFDRSLRINENPTTYTLHPHPHPPTAMPLSDAVMKDTNSMEYAGHMAEEHCFIPARLPSPVSDNDDVTMSGSAPNEAGQVSYTRPSPRPTIPEVPVVRPLSPRHEDEATLVSQAQPRKKPTLIMGYRASCEKCRNKVPGHYSHLIL
ncbi:hypothetical protein N7493_004956 [Penicillium malachiteum]|uniref:Uncharacterized protein n=1 Tax=Penicillium malachiteum TaxID=1324776 RepID=A0AAD6MW33_9EURO|nr:hypothetical protein N7493_004956 [Penicillium malachiteum]